MTSLIAKSALAVVVMLTVAVVAEVGLRVFAPIHTVGTLEWFQYDDELGVRVKEHLDERDVVDYEAEAVTNSIGTFNYEQDYTRYDQLVFAIGDSYTQGAGVPADASYPFQLELMLNADDSGYRFDYGVLNLGLSAYGLSQSTLALERFASAVGIPNVILFLGCANDYSDDQLFASGYRHQHLVDGNPRYGILLAPLQWLTTRSQLVARIKIALSRIRQSAAVNREASRPSREAAAADPPSSVAERQERRLDDLHATANRMGAMLIVSWADAPGAKSRSYGWLKGWAEKKGVGFADWHRHVEPVVDAIPGIPLENHHSTGHYRTWVNQMIARAFADQIRMAGP